MKLKPVRSTYGDPYGHSFYCPGCKESHTIPTVGAHAWGFNGDVETPTFTPSIRVSYTYGAERIEVVCHSFVESGKIRFLHDCTHALRGQTVELPQWDESQFEGGPDEGPRALALKALLADQ
jgi:hypothetical protein